MRADVKFQAREFKLEIAGDGRGMIGRGIEAGSLAKQDLLLGGDLDVF